MGLDPGSMGRAVVVVATGSPIHVGGTAVRARTIIEIRVVAVDELDSELQITADDGTTLSFRSLQSRHATIEHAAQRLAHHCGLGQQGSRHWTAPQPVDRPDLRALPA